jgi:hypothetical protein
VGLGSADADSPDAIITSVTPIARAFIHRVGGELLRAD